MKITIYPPAGYWTDSVYHGRMPDGTYRIFVSDTEDEYGEAYDSMLAKIIKGES